MTTEEDTTRKEEERKKYLSELHRELYLSRRNEPAYANEDSLTRCMAISSIMTRAEEDYDNPGGQIEETLRELEMRVKSLSLDGKNKPRRRPDAFIPDQVVPGSSDIQREQQMEARIARMKKKLDNYMMNYTNGSVPKI